MSEWLPELLAFYKGPVIIGCIFVIAFAAAARATSTRAILAAITFVAIIAMFALARSLSAPTIFLGQVPRLQESVGAVGILAAAGVLFFRTRKGRASSSTLLSDCALGIATFLFVVLFPVAAFLLMASMNPD